MIDYDAETESIVYPKRAWRGVREGKITPVPEIDPVEFSPAVRQFIQQMKKFQESETRALTPCCHGPMVYGTMSDSTSPHGVPLYVGVTL